MALVASAILITTWTTQTEPIMAQWRIMADETISIYSRTAADIYTRDGQEALKTYLQQMDKVSHIRGGLFDSNGKELAGQITLDKSRELVIRALLTDGMQDVSSGPTALVAKRATSSKGTFVLVAEISRPRLISLLAPSRFRGLRVIAVFLTTGLVCYALARYLTGPIIKLRAATKQFSQGDLTVRVGPAIGNRRDEIADLGKDFDEMAERIESLVQAQRRLTSDISHELRSPLARLSVALELARSRSGPGAQTALDRIELEANRLNEMISQLLRLSRLESETAEDKQELIELDQLIKEVVADADFEARNNNRTVNIAQLQSCIVQGRREFLSSAIENVVRNAVKYTGENTTVKVSLSVEDNSANKQALISVRDYGDGVPEDYLKELFRPFFRVADARDRQTGGVGLGLAITEHVIKSHGGKVTAHNAEDGGLVVEIVLPTNTT